MSSASDSSSSTPSNPLPEMPESPRLARSGIVVSSMTMMSRVLGLARDLVWVRFVGDQPGADAFFVAFKIPNFLRRLFAEGAFAQAFVPVLAEYRTQGSHAAVQELINRVAGCLGSVLILLTVFAVVGSPVVAAIFSPGFFLNDPDKFALTADMIRITFPYLFLISMTGFAGAILNSYGRFAVPAFTPVLLNIALITSAIWIAPLFATPVIGLAWGVFAAGIAQFVFQMPFLWRLHLMPRPVIDWQDPGVRKIIKLMVPALFGASVSQINLLLDTVLASFLPHGSIAWLYYSDRLSELPLGVFGIAIATVILPTMSRQHSSQNPHHFNATLDWALQLIFLIAIPATLALVLLAEPILITIYENEKFDLESVAMSVYSLRAYSLGLLAFMLIKILASGFFARQDTKTPVKIGIAAMVTNMVLNFAFVIPLYLYFNLGHMGLALATSLAAYLNAGLLYRGLRKAGVYRAEPGWSKRWSIMLFANGAMVAVLVVLMQRWTEWSTWGAFDRIYHLALLCLGGLFAYATALLLGGLRWRHLRGPQFNEFSPPQS